MLFNNDIGNRRQEIRPAFDYAFNATSNENLDKYSSSSHGGSWSTALSRNSVGPSW